MENQVGHSIQAPNAGWTFGNGTAITFDDHVRKSVPLYREGHNLISQLSDYFLEDGSICYDIGTSTGEIPLMLSERLSISKPNAKFIGIDSQIEMIEAARAKAEHKNLNNIDFINDNVLDFNFDSCDMITSYYTIQFIRPKYRQSLVNSLYNSLNWGGALILFEKVRGPDARFQDLSTGLYNEYKIEQGFSLDQILTKTRSLKGILEPFSSEANFDMLRRSGFSDITTIAKYICFEGILAIK